MEVNTEYKNLICPDCGNKEHTKFDIIMDFGEEISEIKFGCKVCYEMILMSYEELEIKE